MGRQGVGEEGAFEEVEGGEAVGVRTGAELELGEVEEFVEADGEWRGWIGMWGS